MLTTLTCALQEGKQAVSLTLAAHIDLSSGIWLSLCISTQTGNKEKLFHLEAHGCLKDETEVLWSTTNVGQNHFSEVGTSAQHPFVLVCPHSQLLQVHSPQTSS